MRFRAVLTVSLLLSGTCAVPSAGAQEVVQPLPGTTDADRLADAIRRVGASPRDLNALIDAGDLSFRVGDVTAAAALYKRAEQVSASNPRVKAGIARILVNGEHPGEALRYFDEAVRGGVPVAAIAVDRGLAYDLIGEQERAQRDYRLALAQTASDADTNELRRRYALSLGISGRREEALAQIDALLRRSDRGAWRARAFVLAMSNDAAGANRIATSMMPAGMATGLAGFFARLPTLTPSDRAFAVHFGEVSATPARLADLRLAPALAPLGADPYAPFRPTQVAQVDTRAQSRTSRRDRRRDSRDRRADERVQVAATTPVVQAAPVAQAAPVRTASVPPPTQPAVVLAANTLPRTPAFAPVQSATSAAPSGAVPARPLATAPVATTQFVPPVAVAVASSVAATRPPPPIVPPTPTIASTPAPRVPAAAPPAVAPVQVAAAPIAQPVAAGALVAARTPPPQVVASTAPVTSAASPAPIASGAGPLPVEGSALPAQVAARTPSPALAVTNATPPTQVAASPAPAAAPRSTGRGDTDEILARIVANISVPASELEVAPARVEAAATSLDQAARNAERNATAEDARRERLAARRLADKKAADAKAAADRKDAAAKKALADKEAAAEKKAARAEPARIWVQVAGGANQGDLARAWKTVQAKAPSLAGRGAYTTPLRSTNRIVTGPFKTEAEARAFVNQLKREGTPAFSFNSSAGQKMTRLGTSR